MRNGASSMRWRDSFTESPAMEDDEKGVDFIFFLIGKVTKVDYFMYNKIIESI